MRADFCWGVFHAGVFADCLRAEKRRGLISPAAHDEPDRGLPASPPPDARALPLRAALSPGRPPVLPELGGQPRGDAPGLPAPGSVPRRRGARSARSRGSRRPAGGSAGRAGEEEDVGAEEGAQEDGEH